MATAAVRERWELDRVKQKPRARPQRIGKVIYGAREFEGDEALALRLAVSGRMMARSDRRLSRRVERLAHVPDRLSVAKAMHTIEERLVKALWTLSRLPNDRGIGFATRNGVGYIPEEVDFRGQMMANGGQWQPPPMRPPVPSAKSIDDMHEPLGWLGMLERSKAKLLSEGAMSRQGDMENPVRWSRIRKSLSLEHLTIRTMQRRYEAALRELHAVGVRP